MEHVTTTVLGKQLRAARVALGLSVGEAASMLEVEPDLLAQWEGDEVSPDIEALWRMSDAYQRPTDFFIRDVQPRPRRVRFRLAQGDRIAALPIETRRTIARFEELCRYEYELEDITHRVREIVITPLTGTDGGDPEKAAVAARGQLDLSNGPIKDVRLVLERGGVRVFSLPLASNAVAGLSWWHKAFGPCLLVNSQDPPVRRNFSMAHELGHLLRERDANICDLMVDAPEEVFANQFAAAFLVPAWDLFSDFDALTPDAITWRIFRNVGARYGVSADVLGLRAEDLNLVPRGTVLRLKEQEHPFRPRRSKIPGWKRQLGPRFVGVASDAYQSGLISKGVLARYLGVDVRTATAAIESGALEPRE